MLIKLDEVWRRAEDVTGVSVDGDAVRVDLGDQAVWLCGPEYSLDEVADRINAALGVPERFASVDEDGRVALYTVTPQNADRKVWEFEEPWPRPLERGGAGADDERLEASVTPPGARPFRVDIRNDWGPWTEPPGAY